MQIKINITASCEDYNHGRSYLLDIDDIEEKDWSEQVRDIVEMIINIEDSKF